jgi:hypothetical protein
VLSREGKKEQNEMERIHTSTKGEGESLQFLVVAIVLWQAGERVCSFCSSVGTVLLGRYCCDNSCPATLDDSQTCH